MLLLRQSEWESVVLSDVRIIFESLVRANSRDQLEMLINLLSVGELKKKKKKECRLLWLNVISLLSDSFLICTNNTRKRQG